MCVVEDTIRKQAALFTSSRPKSLKEQGGLNLSEGSPGTRQ